VSNKAAADNMTSERKKKLNVGVYNVVSNGLKVAAD